MARVFYYTATGEIYGVNPGPFSGTLPADVSSIDVPEAPDKIAWPDSRGEKFNKVDSGMLVAAPFTPPPESAERLAFRALAAEIDAGTKGAVAKIDALLGPKP